MKAVQSVEVESVLDEVSRTATVPEKTANKEPLFARVMMIVTTHQPIFLPWPGFFYKAVKADCMVLLDDVQYPLGRGWVNRNRLKNEQGALWLRVPVRKKHRGLQRIREVEMCGRTAWPRKHLQSIRQNYVHAPYFADYFPGLESIYLKRGTSLAHFNVELIRFLREALALKTELLLQSDLGIEGQGTDLIVDICRRLGAEKLLIFPFVEGYLDPEKMARGGVRTVYAEFHPPVYPQLWGDFVYNLSTLDLLLNCGPKGHDVVAAA